MVHGKDALTRRGPEERRVAGVNETRRAVDRRVRGDAIFLLDIGSRPSELFVLRLKLDSVA